jgi:hypothetical protein
MNPKLIKSALKARLAEGSTLVGVWPNIDPQDPLERPYFEVDIAAVDRNGPAIKGTSVREVGRMSIVIVVEGGSSEDAVSDYAYAIGQLFNQSLRIPTADSMITIQEPPDFRRGFRDGPDFRVPVIIRYSATNN